MSIISNNCNHNGINVCKLMIIEGGEEIIVENEKWGSPKI